ncbi:MAG: hypothetical protein AB7P18_30700, partial [Candidatus Binatia bacterium]
MTRAICLGALLLPLLALCALYPEQLARNSVRHEICQVRPSLVEWWAMKRKQVPKGKAKTSAAGEVAPPV